VQRTAAALRLGSRRIQSEPEVLQFFVEHWRAIKAPDAQATIKDTLMAVVLQSKGCV
jgi:hypothetical protein